MIILNADVIENIVSYLPILTIRSLNVEYKEKANILFSSRLPSLYSVLYRRWLPIIRQRIRYRLLLNKIRSGNVETSEEWIKSQDEMIFLRDELYYLNNKKQKLILEYRLFHKLQGK